MGKVGPRNETVKTDIERSLALLLLGWAVLVAIQYGLMSFRRCNRYTCLSPQEPDFLYYHTVIFVLSGICFALSAEFS